MGAGKWIGGIIGFMAGGPLGALAGYALGSLIEPRWQYCKLYDRLWQRAD